MRKISKEAFDFFLKSHSARKNLAWLATKIRQHARLRKIINKFNPNSDPWVNDGHEFDDLRNEFAVDFQKLLKRKPSKPIGLIVAKNDSAIHSFKGACRLLGLEHQLFNPENNDFLDLIKKSNCDFYLSKPNHSLAIKRDLFLEKEVIIRKYIGKLIYPKSSELEIYESKRLLAYFLESNNIPHPKTFISYSREEAISYAQKCRLPQVFKTRNGAGSSGVEIAYTRNQAVKLTKLLFDDHYVNKALSDYRDLDYGYVLLQEYVEDAREFRIIKVGESWFGHEKAKLESQEFMSGSGVNTWTPPQRDLLDFCENLANQFGFVTMCFDIFMDSKGQYLVNELQTWFGSYNPSQMYINKVPGRYKKQGGDWIFEPGLFNELQSIPLRMVAYINLGEEA